MRRTLLLLTLVAAEPTFAQRLPYRPVTMDELASSPRLAYQRVEGDDTLATAATKEAVRRRKWLQWALLDRAEYASQKGQDGYSWDFSALLGGEKNRLWVASVGEGPAWGDLEYLELQALYSRYVGGSWDLNAGLRYDAIPSPHRFYATLGAQYDDGNFWLGGFGYLSHKGELSARLAAYYNQKLIGPLFLQPSFEIDASGEDVPELGIGRGFYYAEAGLRLRYEIEEAFAPYVGLSWSRSLGRTARLEREAGDDPETKSLVLGVRSAF